MIYQSKEYVPSPEYHWFFEGEHEVLTLCSASFEEESEMQIEISGEKEALFFTKLIQMKANFDSLCNEFEMEAGDYDPLIEELIEIGIFIRMEEEYLPSRTIYDGQSIAFLPFGRKQDHDRWQQVLEDLKRSELAVAFSPVFHPVFREADQRFGSDWLKIHAFGTYKSMRFSENHCYLCYVERFCSRFGLAKRMYRSGQILHVGYEQATPPASMTDMLLEADGEMDLETKEVVALWPMAHCPRCSKKEDLYVSVY